MDESYLEWLQSLAGLNPAKARRVAKLFPTFEHLRAADRDQLGQLDGLSLAEVDAIKRAVRESGGRDADGRLFLCPECGSFAGTKASSCPFCGVAFSSGEEAIAAGLDEFLREEETGKLCLDCGAVMARDAIACPICRREYSRSELALLPSLSGDIDETRFCARCGAYLVAGSDDCAICGTPLAGPSSVPTAANSHRGLGQGFLSRWQKVVEVTPSTETERLLEELSQYDKLVETDPSLERVWAKRGRVLARLGRTVDASESLARAAELDPSKDDEYRLEVLDIMRTKGDMSFLPSRWRQPAATSAPPSVQPKLMEALDHYDALLASDPNLAVAWRTKGEILERIGRSAEAKTCFARAESIERQAAEDGRTGAAGLTADSGLVAGTPSPTRADARSTGHVNGKTNGRTNGRTNGTGGGRINGLTNGAVNGLRGAVNGVGGWTGGAGRTNGLVNGNGVTDGHRGRYAPRRLPTQPHWARSLAGIAAVVALLVLVPILASLLAPPGAPVNKIQINGNFSDWATFAAYVNAPPPSFANPDINLLEVKVTSDATNLYVYAKVQGTLFLAPWTNGTETVFVFVDEDNSRATGYPIAGMGADLLAVVTGWDGRIQSMTRYVFNETGMASSNDFRRFGAMGSIQSAASGAEIEMAIPIDGIPALAKVLVYGVDNRGNGDAMAGIIQPNRATVIIDQTTVAPGILANATSPILRVLLSPMGGSAWLTGLNLTRRGSSTDPVTVSAYLDAGAGTFGPQDPLVGRALLTASGVHLPLNLNLTAPTTLWLAGSWTNRTPLRTFGLLVTGLTGNGTASVSPPDTTLDYLVSAPTTPTVDGAFADWAGHPYGQDPLGDVVNGTGSLVYDSNVDLLATAVDAGANFTGYAQVAGHILGGQDIPLDVSRPFPYTPSNNTTVPAPYVPQEGMDVLYAYVDSDNSSLTGVRAIVENVTYGFDAAIAVVGRNGVVNSSSLYAAAPNGTWRYAGPASAAVDSHRVEFAVNATLLNLRAGYRVVYMSSDWRNQYDVALPDASIRFFTVGAFSSPLGKNPPVITFAKTVSATQSGPGTSLTYLIYFNNTGKGLAKKVWINDTMPVGVTFVSASTSPATVSGSRYGWVFTNIGPASTNVLQIAVLVNGNATDGSSQKNTATVAYSDTHGTIVGRGSATATFLYQRPTITVAKTVSPANAKPGQTVTYTIYYNNTGSVVAGTVSIADTMPSGLVNITSTPAPTAVSGRTYYWNFTNVALGSHSITITATISPSFKGTQLVNWAYLNYTSKNGYILQSSKASAIVAVPELSDFLFVLAVPLLVIGLRRRAHRRAQADEETRIGSG